MSESANFEIDGLHFAVVHPRELAETSKQWLQIKDAQRRHYRRVFKNRRPEEIDYLVKSSATKQWKNPNKARGVGARKEQLRSTPRVAVALNDRTNTVEGYAYGAKNASWKEGLWTPLGLGVAVLKLFAPVEKFRDHCYFWTSENVNPNERIGLDIVNQALLLDSADPDLNTTYYRWDEEEEILPLLDMGGYAPDTDKTGVVITEDLERFGPNTRPVKQERWVGPNAGVAFQNLVAAPETADVVAQAKATIVS